MKTKMIFGIIVVVLITVIGVSLIGAQKLKDIRIRKEILISGSLEKAFEQVVYLKNFPKWSPFLEADPTQEVEVKGNDGQVGAQYHWLGNKGKDVGFQEIKEIKSQSYVKLGCDIQKPFRANPIFEYSFEQVGDKVKVIQDFSLKSGGVDAFFMWLFGARKDIEKMNGRGLELLKLAVEK